LTKPIFFCERRVGEESVGGVHIRREDRIEEENTGQEKKREKG
jgi:hypothetical protein